MFLGTHTPRLDEKGRLFLPAKFREAFALGLVITPGQERCLYVWTQERFDAMSLATETAPVTARGARDYGRLFYAGAWQQEPDKQGRISVPPKLRAYAGLDRECTVIGVNTRVEIWDSAAWDTYVAEQEPLFADLSMEVLPSG